MANVVVWIVWVVAAFACLASGVAVVSFSNPFYSALALIGNLASLAVLYLLLSAEFVAAGQVLVYAGAVMVMFLFVTAYLGGRADAPWAGGPTWQQVGAVLAAGAILVEVIVVIGLKAGGSLAHEAKIDSSFGSPHEIGRLFLYPVRRGRTTLMSGILVAPLMDDLGDNDLIDDSMVHEVVQRNTDPKIYSGYPSQLQPRSYT